MSAGIGLAGIALALAALFVIAREARRRKVLGAEASRKLVHVGMGLACVPLPVFVHDPRVVIGAAAVACLAFAAVRAVPALHDRFGCVLHDVARRSYGDFAYIAGVAASFVLAHGDLLVFAVPVAVLACADSLAAVIGARFGSHRLAVFGSVKTVEGSAAFFVVALACVAVPLAILGNASAAGAGLLLATVLTAVEYASGRGLDNLTIPLAGAALLRMIAGGSPLGGIA